MFEKEKRNLAENPGEYKNASEEIETRTEGDSYTSGVRTEQKIRGFDVAKKLSELEGPIVEVAGPTMGGFEQVDLKPFAERVLTSNLHPGVPLFVDDRVIFEGKVDFQADAVHLPIAADSVAAFLCACLGPTALEPITSSFANRQELLAYVDALHTQVIQEALRVLKEKGLLIWENGRISDILAARRCGFHIMQKINTVRIGESTTCSFVAEKSHDPSAISISDKIEL